MDYPLAHERFSDLRETIFVEEGTLQRKASIEEFLSEREPLDRRMLPETNTRISYFIAHSSDLAIGGESL
jgi:hypothetical protein